MRHEEEADGNSPDWPAEMGALLAGIRPRLAAYRHGITLGELRGKNVGGATLVRALVENN